ncbi:MAG: glycoside hydrolase [Acinetobacter sp.]|uniref:sialidase family protein n=1 Tax=Acinetobacter sp. TaxID=472 RepID=UPI00258A7BC7|nr:sialidase family protein [Acinetobacter sp.]MCE1272432.1 glycoside hydrolase [Acinetobacter sp.]
MAEPITIQQLIDASQDAETLEQVVNGPSGELIETRLGRQVYTLASVPQINTMTREEVDAALSLKAPQATTYTKVEVDNALSLKAPQATTYTKIEVDNALSTKAPQSSTYTKTEVDTTFAAYVGGRKAYTTLALAQAAQSSLPANTAIEVTNDGANNGTYQWNGTTLTKSAYDPLTQAKGYTDTSTATLKENFIVEQSNEGIFFLTLDRVPLFYVLNDGSFHLAGDSTDLRERVKNFDRTDSPVLYEFQDLNGDMVAYVSSVGELFIIGNNESIQQQILKSENSSYLSLKINSILDSEGRTVFAANITSTFNNKPIGNLTTIEPFPNETGKVQRIGAALKLANNKILYFWGGGVGSPYNGDGEGVKLYKRILTYTDGGSISSKGTKELFRETTNPAGIAKHPMLGRTKSGRIVLIWDERNTVYSPSNPYNTMIAFSDDEGVTFTAPVQIPNNPAFTFQVVGSTGTIITLSTGRLVCPMYYTLPFQTMGMMYSDDNGVTWQYGDVLSLVDGVLQEPSITFDETDKIYVSSRSTVSNMMKHLSVSTNGGQTLQDLGFQAQLSAPQVASSIYYDFENKLMLHSSPTGSSRNRYKVQLSGDKCATWQFAQQPFADNFYIGYSQIIKLASNTYAVVVEGLQNSAVVNSAENIGIYIFNTKEVFNNVSRN